jgi:hypothetical protein
MSKHSQLEHNPWRTEYKIDSKVWEINEVVAGLFPRMDQEEFEILGKDIEKNGLKDPVILLDQNGLVIDGWHRVRAIYEFSKTGRRSYTHEHYKLQARKIPDDADPKLTVLSKNLHRRHLTADQRAKILENCGIKSPGQGARTDRTSEHVPKLTGGDKKTLQNRKFLQNIHPHLHESVERGEMSSRKAIGIARDKVKPEIEATQATPSTVPPKFGEPASILNTVTSRARSINKDLSDIGFWPQSPDDAEFADWLKLPQEQIDSFCTSIDELERCLDPLLKFVHLCKRSFQKVAP